MAEADIGTWVGQLVELALGKWVVGNNTLGCLYEQIDATAAAVVDHSS